MAWRPQLITSEIHKTDDTKQAKEKLQTVQSLLPNTFKSLGLALTSNLFRYILDPTPTSGESANIRAASSGLKQVLKNVLDGNDMNELFATGEHKRDPIELARDLVEYLVRNVAWTR